MDRSTYNTPGGYGNYSESSSNGPFSRAHSSKARLPIHSYSWYRIDSSFPKGDHDHRLNLNDVGLLTKVLRGPGYFADDSSVKSGYVGNLDHFHAMISNKLLSKVRSSPVKLGVALGEYRETAELFVSATHRIVDIFKGIKDLRRFDIRDALEHIGRGLTPNRAANAYLEWTYGVKPVMADIRGAVDALFSSHDTYLEIKNIRVSNTWPAHASTAWKYYASKDSKDSNLTGIIKGTGFIRYVVSNPFLASADQLGLLNPVQLAWQLYPLSFVVDWFVNVGGLLGNIVPPQGIDFVEGYTYVKARGSSYVKATLDYGSFQELLYANSTEVIKDRRGLNGFPQFTLIRPKWFDLSQGQVISSAALLAQRIFGSR